MRRWKQDWLSGNEGKWVNIWRVEHKRPPCRVCCMCVYYAWAVKKYSSHTLSVNYSHLYDLKHLFTSLSCSLQKQWHSIQNNFTLPLYFPNCASDDIIHGSFFIRFFQKKIFMLSSQGLIFSGILKDENWNTKYLTIAHKIKFSRLNWLTSHHI